MKADIHPGIFMLRSDSYIQLFEESARNLIGAADLLRAVMSEEGSDTIGTAVQAVQDAGEQGDEITHRIYTKLNRSFITPFERKDIHLLASEIDVALKSVKGIIRRKYIYRHYDPLPVYWELADLIYEAALEIGSCIRHISDPGSNRLKIQKSCSRIKAIEHIADEKYSSALALLFDQVTDIKILMSTNKILEMLERCVDELEDISDTIRAILMKVV